ncbi:hypothetical protein FSP39_000583 [Pinctada imbricata]|uniref:Ubiquitin carboxyl-terminal hydrolase n=1 Tax=Pinctada imbricata TaxID=66713 RepID=A0AA88Y6V3_PINIB|nr:hypothetical protein FSP39_000583 [Pinctada imbricata]
MSEQRWIPLESNPDYIRNLGVPENVEFCDIFGTEADLLAMVPKPVLAVVLLFPINEKTEQNPIGEVKPESDVFFVKQTIRNACGTVAIVHSLANNDDKIDFAVGKPFKKFLEETLNLTPQDRADYLEKDMDMGRAHESTAQEGQTQAPSREDEVNTHFVAFVHKNGNLYELDGRKDAPTHHGTTTADTLLEDAIVVAKKFMARDPEQLNFTLMALAAAQ